MERKSFHKRGSYGLESRERSSLRVRTIQLSVFLVLAGVPASLIYKTFRGGVVFEDASPRTLETSRLDPSQTNVYALDTGMRVSSIVRMPFGTENVDAAIEEKIALLQQIIDSGNATPIPENEVLVNRINDMLYRHFELSLDVRNYESIEHMEIDIIRNYIRDQFLSVCLTPVEERPKYNITRIQRAQRRDRIEQVFRLSTHKKEPEELTCDGLFVEELRGDVLYIKIQHFRDENLNEVLREVFRRNQGKFVVLNLENNLGGSLNEVFQVCELFPGVRTIARESDTGTAYTTSESDDEWDRIENLVCIFNGRSASASEILLADCRSMGYVLYGRPSHGKNAYGYGMKEVVEGYEISLYKSVARIRDGDTNQKIFPNVQLPKTFSEYDFRLRLVRNPEKDPQLVLDEMIAELMVDEQ